MAFRLTIAGVDQTSLIRTNDKATITRPLNGQATAKFTCNPSLIPAQFAKVVMYEQDGTTPLFAGVITKRSIRPVVRWSAGSKVRTLSISSPKKSRRSACCSPLGNRSTSPPRTAYSP